MATLASLILIYIQKYFVLRFFLQMTQENSTKRTPPTVLVHPTALLSISDHYTRSARNTSRRVVGALLGEQKEDGIHVLTAFGVPFEEDVKDPRVFYVDHNYHESMFELHRKVNPREKVVGWYSSHGSIKQCDLAIHEGVFRRYTPHPVFLCVDVLATSSLQLPVKAYTAETSETAPGVVEFSHVECRVAMVEAEEVGVEHLLRDMKTAAADTAADLTFLVDERMNGVKLLTAEIEKISKYLEDVLSGKLPINHKILKTLQNVLSSLGDKFSQHPELKKTLNLENNDASLAMYVGALLRTTVALHNLIDNKLKLRGKTGLIKPVAAASVAPTLTNKDDKVGASGA